MEAVVLLVLLGTAATAFDELQTISDAENCLERYGYINNNSLDDFEPRLIDFQECYNLSGDGSLNSETLVLMNRPRCTISKKQFTDPNGINRICDGI